MNRVIPQKPTRKIRPENGAKKRCTQRTQTSSQDRAPECFRVLQLTSRLRNGGYRKALRHSFLDLMKHPDARRMEYLRTDVMWLLLGDRLMRRHFRDYTVRRMDAYGGEGRLYHFAPADCVERIRTNGLQPSKLFVYLTDAPDIYKHDFLPWKDRQIGKPTAYTLLEIDTKRLLRTQKIFRTEQPHEFVTGQIDTPRYVIFPDDGDFR